MLQPAVSVTVAVCEGDTVWFFPAETFTHSYVVAGCTQVGQVSAPEICVLVYTAEIVGISVFQGEQLKVLITGTRFRIDISI